MNSGDQKKTAGRWSNLWTMLSVIFFVALGLLLTWHRESRDSGLIVLVFVSLVLILSALATESQKARKQRKDQTEAYLNRLNGQLTLDEAVMKWGKPISVVDGAITSVAIWREEKKGLGAMVLPKGWELRIAFDRKTNTMTRWDYTDSGGVDASIDAT